MKFIIASDIHGDLDSAKRIFEAYDREEADKLLLLGDLLYHGPRNDLPETYAPKEVIKLLNERKNDILAVRGNCDTEVDQMVLTFPILADYAYVNFDGLSVFMTHGHVFNPENLPPLRPGEILLHGHTHILACDELENGCFRLNPGSAAIPKGGNPRTYAIFEDRTFTVKELDGKTVLSRKF